jgi:hypothetical protein
MSSGPDAPGAGARLRNVRKAARLALLASLLAGCATAGSSRTGPSWELTVAAGPYERLSTPVAFDLPAGAGSGSYHLEGTSGERIPVQVDASGRAHFILDELGAGEEAHFTLVTGAAPGAEVEMEREGPGVAFEVGGHPVLRYNSEITPLPRPDINPIYRRGGYIHPIFSPEGVLMTGDYPADHLHHHGIFASWTRTVFEGEQVDFWNVADRKGDVLPVALDSTWSGPVYGGLVARHRYVALTTGTPKDALNETWDLRVFNVTGNGRPYWLFELDVEQTTATSSPLVLPTYHYGGVAIRGREDWLGADKAKFLTSEGKDRSNGNETRARWTSMGGLAEGEPRGMAVLSHPDNFRHPEPVRIHPTEPYFVWTPSQLGEWSIQPGQPHHVRYRYVIYDGEADAAELDRIWNDFAHPPTVTVTGRS